MCIYLKIFQFWSYWLWRKSFFFNLKNNFWNFETKIYSLQINCCWIICSYSCLIYYFTALARSLSVDILWQLFAVISIILAHLSRRLLLSLPLQTMGHYQTTCPQCSLFLREIRSNKGLDFFQGEIIENEYNKY